MPQRAYTKPCVFSCVSLLRSFFIKSQTKPKNQVCLETEHIKSRIFLCSSLQPPCPVQRQGGFRLLDRFFIFAGFFTFFGSSGFTSSFSTSSSIFRGDSSHVRTAGDKGCCSRALPYSLYRQNGLCSTGFRASKTCFCLS